MQCLRQPLFLFYVFFSFLINFTVVSDLQAFYHSNKEDKRAYCHYRQHKKREDDIKRGILYGDGEPQHADANKQRQGNEYPDKRGLVGASAEINVKEIYHPNKFSESLHLYPSFFGS